MDLTSPNDTVPAPGGALTEMLRALRLEGVDYGRCELGAPWAVLFPVQKAARFHFIGRAGCWLLSPPGEWMELKAGDVLLLPRGAEHILASAPGVQAEPLESYGVEPLQDNVYSVEPLQDNVYAVSNGGHGAKTLLFCGSMHFNHDGSHPLLAMMPDMLRAKELMAGEPGIPHLLEAMADEATRNRAGSGMMLARLADVLAAAIIRSWVENSAGDITGWIAAIKDRDIGRVLVAIHRQPDRNWTVEALAREMGAHASGKAVARGRRDAGVGDRRQIGLRFGSVVQPGLQAHRRQRAQPFARRGRRLGKRLNQRCLQWRFPAWMNCQVFRTECHSRLGHLQ